MIHYKTMMPLLVFTSDATFGELVQQSLEERGRFTISVPKSQAEAEAVMQAYFCPLAILDADDQTILPLAETLKRINPSVQFIVIGGGELTPVSRQNLKPVAHLSKPLHIPDLVEAIDRALPVKEGQGMTENQASHELPWLEDVNRAAQHLTRLTLESSAQAALITRREVLWAYAGQLPQNAAQELTQLIARYWDRHEESDLVRFIRLETTKAEHMLYATRLTGDLVLALVFDAETSFTTIRIQASQLVQSLSTLSTRNEDEEEEFAPDLTPLSEILADVPPPNPSQESSNDLFPSSGIWESELGPTIPSSFSRETSPAIPLATAHLTQPQPEAKPDLGETAVSPSRRQESAPLEHSIELGETIPSSTTEVARKITVEPVSASVYNLNYACLLIPRFRQHHLTSDLADRLAEWIPQLCIAYGWRLEYLAIRPDYLQWIVNVPPPTPPSYLMRIVRQQTSSKIFEEFPRFKKDNPSGDFWAPGYLIMGGNQPHPAQLVKEFIAQIRQRQGLTKRSQ